ncbi:MAG: hypothetical protein H0T60_16800, partial [Acidobacteria bacterium]|nr:hypothetical protein [Acidobacteriota bacterium]
LGGERMLRSFLSKLDESIADIIRDGGGPVSVTVFSDHGNHFRKYRRVRLKEPLRRAGFKFDKGLKDARSVVFPQFGLIGCAVLFTREENEQRLAAAASSVEGVDFVTFEEGGVVHVLSIGGEARIQKRGERYRYLASRGDPLGLDPALSELSKRGKVDADGFVADSDWFDTTRDGQLPDAVRRIYDGASGEVGNPANVIVSFKDGYYSGSAALDVFASLRATHGNLGREQSYGFLMSTSGGLPPFVRAEEVWRVLGAPRLSRSAAHAARLITPR